MTSSMKLISCCDIIYKTSWSQIECLKYLDRAVISVWKKLKQREKNMESGWKITNCLWKQRIQSCIIPKNGTLCRKQSIGTLYKSCSVRKGQLSKHSILIFSQYLWSLYQAECSSNSRGTKNKIKTGTNRRERPFQQEQRT